MPMHFLGPAPQGANPAGSFLHHARNIMLKLKRFRKLLSVPSERMGAGGHKGTTPSPCAVAEVACVPRFHVKPCDSVMQPRRYTGVPVLNEIQRLATTNSTQSATCDLVQRFLNSICKDCAEFFFTRA